MLPRLFIFSTLPYRRDFSIPMATASLPFACGSTSFVCQWTLTRWNHHLRPSSILLIRQVVRFAHAPRMVSCKLVTADAIIACYSFRRRPAPLLSVWNGDDLAFQVVICFKYPLACRRTIIFPSCILTLMRRSDLLSYSVEMASGNCSLGACCSPSSAPPCCFPDPR